MIVIERNGEEMNFMRVLKKNAFLLKQFLKKHQIESDIKEKILGILNEFLKGENFSKEDIKEKKEEIYNLLKNSENYKKGDYVSFLRTCIVNKNEIGSRIQGLLNKNIERGLSMNEEMIKHYEINNLLNERRLILVGYKYYGEKVNILLYKENGKFVAISKISPDFLNFLKGNFGKKTEGLYTKFTYDTFEELMEGILKQDGLNYKNLFKIDIETLARGYFVDDFFDNKTDINTDKTVNTVSNETDNLKMDEIIEKIYNNPNIIIIGSGAYDGYKGYYHCIDENIRRELEKESGMSGNYFGLGDMRYYITKKDNCFKEHYPMGDNYPGKALYVKQKFKWGQGFGMLFSMKDDHGRSGMGIFFIIVPENDKETQKLIEENPEIVNEMFMRKFQKYNNNKSESYEFKVTTRQELNIQDK